MIEVIEKEMNKYRKYIFRFFLAEERNVREKRKKRKLEFFDTNFKKHTYDFDEGNYYKDLSDIDYYKFIKARDLIYVKFYKTKLITEDEFEEWLTGILEEARSCLAEQLKLY